MISGLFSHSTELSPTSSSSLTVPENGCPGLSATTGRNLYLLNSSKIPSLSEGSCSFCLDHVATNRFRIGTHHAAAGVARRL